MNVKPESLYNTDGGRQQVMAVYQAILDAWPTPHERLIVPTRLGETFVLASGETARPGLVLLHGTDSNALYWLKDTDSYRRHFRVLAPDIPGEPGKSVEVRPDWKSPAYLEWMEDILAALEVPRAALLGLSQGAWVAIKFAISHPERVDRLALISPAGITSLRLSFALRLLPWLPPGIRNPCQILKTVFGNKPIPADVSRFSKPMLEHFKSRKRAMPEFADADLRRLTMPVQLIVSRRDAIFNSNKTIARLRKLLPRNLRVIILDNGGHSLYDLAKLVLPFLSADLKMRTASALR